MDPSRPAHQVWTVRRKPVDILGKLMIRLDFQLVDWDITVHHAICSTSEQADAECRKLREDMQQLLDGQFRSKYRIAHDLRGGF